MAYFAIFKKNVLCQNVKFLCILVLMSICVDLSGSKTAITSTYFIGFQIFLDTLAARELRFTLICAIWLYTVPVIS